MIPRERACVWWVKRLQLIGEASPPIPTSMVAWEQRHLFLVCLISSPADLAVSWFPFSWILTLPSESNKFFWHKVRIWLDSLYDKSWYCLPFSANTWCIFWHGISGLQAFEIMAIAAVGNNLITYVINEMHFSLSKSANIVTNFVGTIFILALLGGYLSDSYLGCFWTMLIFGFVELSVRAPFKLCIRILPSIV